MVAEGLGLHDMVAGTVVDDRSWQPWYTRRRRAQRPVGMRSHRS